MFSVIARRLRKCLESYQYRAWIKKYDTFTSEKECLLKARLEEPAEVVLPRISVILPVYNPPLRFLREAIASVTTQVYQNWELCIVDDGSTDLTVVAFLQELQKKNTAIKLVISEKQGGIVAATNKALSLASGDFVTFLDHDDCLTRDALAEVALAIREMPEVGFLYSDEDKLNRWGHRTDPFFKPDWNPDLLRSLNYCSHLSVIKKSLLRENALNPLCEGAQDWDLILRVTEQLESSQIVHLSKVLYHWRISASSTAGSIASKPKAIAASKRALCDHLERTHQCFSSLEQIHEGGHWNIKRSLPSHREPKVSIIIPTRNRRELLEQCLESIFSKTNYPHYEIIIADNGSEEASILEYYEQLTSTRKNIRLLSLPGPFNYSAINNRAVLEAQGEILVLLNNDIEIVYSGWLHELVVQAIRPEVGAVGGLLFYPKGAVQHAGVILGIAGPMKVNGVAGHAGKCFPKQRYVGGNRMCVTQNFSAVTGACLAVRKKLYEEVGGLDEQDLAISFNDVDFCLKLVVAGYWNIWTPSVVCLHHESASRGYENTPEKKKRFAHEVATMRQRWSSLLDHDPAYNRNLTFEKEDWSLAWPPRES